MANHAENEKKPIYKKWWFWIIIIVIGIIIGTSQNNNTVDTSTNNYQKNNSVEVTIVDFSTMSKEEVKAWIDTNKINGKITEEYSNDIENKKEADIKINKFYKFAKIVKGRSVLQVPSFNISQLLTDDIVSNLA